MRARWAAALWVVGCRAPEGPAETLRAYLNAVEHHRTEAAYGLTSTDYRARHDRQDFERAMAGSQTGTARFRASSVTLRADARLADGSSLPLVYERGAWRIDRDPLDFYRQAAPDEALRSFVRAVEQRRYDVLQRFVPERYRATYTVEVLRERWEGDGAALLKEQLERVRAHLDDTVEVSGPKARLPLGDRKQARLVRENGLWRVESLE
jgi:hypothetical protein